MFRVAPGVVRARSLPISCWWAKLAAMAWSVTAQRATRQSGRSTPTTWRRCSMPDARTYIRDGAEIYRRSFAIIRAEADLTRFSPIEERVAVRIIHACGMTEITRDIAMSPASPKPRAGRSRRRAYPNAIPRWWPMRHARPLPPTTPSSARSMSPAAALAHKIGNTRTAAAMELWGDRLAGAWSPSAMRRQPCSICSKCSMAARSRRPRDRRRWARRRTGIPRRLSSLTVECRLIVRQRAVVR